MTATTYISAGALAIVGYTILAALASRARLWQLVGGESYKRCNALTRSLTTVGARTTVIRVMGNAALIGGLVLLARHLQTRPSWSDIGHAWPACVLLLVGVLDRFRHGMPAMVILLGPSDARCRRLQYTLTRRLFPLRVVSLLDTDGVFEFHGAGDSFRLADGDWRAVVRELVIECPLVVFDLRAPTVLIEEELTMVMTTSAGSKTACLFSKGSSSALPDSAAAVKTEDELLALLVPIAIGRAPMPAPARPLGARSEKA